MSTPSHLSHLANDLPVTAAGKASFQIPQLYSKMVLHLSLSLSCQSLHEPLKAFSFIQTAQKKKKLKTPHPAWRTVDVSKNKADKIVLQMLSVNTVAKPNVGTAPLHSWTFIKQGGIRVGIGSQLRPFSCSDSGLYG